MKRILATLSVLCVLPLFLSANSAEAAGHDAKAKRGVVFSDSTGNVHHGSWSHGYVTSNGGSHIVNVQWDIDRDGAGCSDVNGQWCMKYHMKIQTGNLPGPTGEKCVQVALDTGNITGMHMDSQVMRNCRDNSTRDMDPYWWSEKAWTHDVGNDVFLSRLQIATYDRVHPSYVDGSLRNGTVSNKDCEIIATNTDTNSDCEEWERGSNVDWGRDYTTIRQKQPPGVSPADVWSDGGIWTRSNE